MSKPNKFSIVIVNYRSKKSLAKCLASVFEKLEKYQPEIIVVNNDSEEILEDLKAGFPSLSVIESGSNLGYGAANNLGSKKAVGKYLFFLNPDTKIINVDLNSIAEEFENDKEVGIIGLRVTDSTKGSVQPWTVGREIGWAGIILNNLGFYESKKLWDKPENVQVDWVSGTAMIVRKETFFEIGGFDENFFMYFEDMDICKRVRSGKKKVIYRPKHTISHESGTSYGYEAKKQKMDYYRSQDYYFQKHFGKFNMLLLRSLRKTFGK